MPSSSPKYAQPLTLELRPSRRILLLLTSTHLLALAALAASAVPLPLCVALAALTAASAWHAMQQARLYRRLVWLADGSWLLSTRFERSLAAELLPDSVIGPLGAVLIFRCRERGEIASVVLAGDSLDPQTFRRLRVRIRVQTSDIRCQIFGRALQLVQALRAKAPF